MPKLYHFKFLMVQKSALNIFVGEKWSRDQSVLKSSYLQSCGAFRFDHLVGFLIRQFVSFGHGVYIQCIGSPMGTNCVVYLANFYLFTYEFDFIKCLLKSNTCPCSCAS